MTPTEAHAALMAHTRQTMALAQTAGILGWDQETMMPRKGQAQRAEQSAALSAALHARRSDPQLAEWLEIAARDGAALGRTGRRTLALIARSHARATRIPGRLIHALAHLASAGHQTWIAARAAGRFSDFAPVLAQMITLKREEAACFADDPAHYYDALLDDYEPGMTSAVLTPLLEALRAPLTDLRARIGISGRMLPRLTGHYPAEAQLALSREVAALFGYDFEAGRLDLAVHPFSSGTGGDVRITTRVDEAEPLGCLLSTIHEVGHAVYEQNIAPDALLTPIGAEASMGIHESQSRMFENQIARSRPFADWLHGRMRAHFPDYPLDRAEDLYGAMNRVETGFIRTEADEVHYNLHVLLRYELERDLIGGALEVTDLEEAWNTRFRRDFGLDVPDARRGVLQDIHWPKGLFGYFPTYALGNIYAAELFAALRRALGDVDGMIAAGRLDPIRAWLTQNIHRHGNAQDPVDLVTAALGHAPQSGPLVDHLRGKFGGLYDL